MIVIKSKQIDPRVTTKEMQLHNGGTNYAPQTQVWEICHYVLESASFNFKMI